LDYTSPECSESREGLKEGKITLPLVYLSRSSKGEAESLAELFKFRGEDKDYEILSVGKDHGRSNEFDPKRRIRGKSG